MRRAHEAFPAIRSGATLVTKAMPGKETPGVTVLLGADDSIEFRLREARRACPRRPTRATAASCFQGKNMLSGSRRTLTLSSHYIYIYPVIADGLLCLLHCRSCAHGLLFLSFLCRSAVLPF